VWRGFLQQAFPWQGVLWKHPDHKRKVQGQAEQQQGKIVSSVDPFIGNFNKSHETNHLVRVEL
jgi:hypothetical protein